MEKQQDDILLKVRSHRSILSASFGLYTRLFRQMLKSNCVPILITAAVATAAGMLLLYSLYLLVPLVVLAIVLEVATWLLAGHWLTRHTWRSMARAAKRHWLALTGATLATYVIVLPLCALVSLPLAVLILAQWEARSSTLMGDPDGMPSYMPYLSAMAWFITMFIQVCIRLFIVYVCYYTYGSAETRKKEREQQKRDIQ